MKAQFWQPLVVITSDITPCCCCRLCFFPPFLMLLFFFNNKQTRNLWLFWKKYKYHLVVSLDGIVSASSLRLRLSTAATNHSGKTCKCIQLLCLSTDQSWLLFRGSEKSPIDRKNHCRQLRDTMFSFKSFFCAFLVLVK